MKFKPQNFKLDLQRQGVNDRKVWVARFYKGDFLFAEYHYSSRMTQKEVTIKAKGDFKSDCTGNFLNRPNEHFGFMNAPIECQLKLVFEHFTDEQFDIFLNCVVKDGCLYTFDKSSKTIVLAYESKEMRDIMESNFKQQLSLNEIEHKVK